MGGVMVLSNALVIKKLGQPAQKREFVCTAVPTQCVVYRRNGDQKHAAIMGKVMIISKINWRTSFKRLMILLLTSHELWTDVMSNIGMVVNRFTCTRRKF